MDRFLNTGIMAGIVALFTGILGVIGKISFATKGDLQRHEDVCGNEQRRCNDRICQKVDTLHTKIDDIRETVIRLDEKTKQS